MKYHTIIVGAGIAGASAALQLSRHQRVLLLEAEHPAAGASGVAGGLFSPMIALRGRPVWCIDEAIEAFHAQLKMAGASQLFDDRGVLRPAKDQEQVAFFKKSVDMAPNHAEWWSEEQVAERYPAVKAPAGALFAKTGGAISTTAFTEAMVSAAVNNGATYLQTRVTGWGFNLAKGWVTIYDENRPPADAMVRFDADRIILAIGKSFLERPFQDLDLHAVKGQTIRVKRPAWLSTDEIPPISGQAYIIPEKDTLAIGSSFEHTFKDEKISRSVSQLLLKKASSMFPKLIELPILEEHVGIRVTVPRIRLPMVGPWKKGSPLWVFTGFGSKGLLLVPLLASRLLKYFDQPAAIPSEIRVRVKT